MLGKKERHFAPLINVSLEELVPQDHFYRYLERTLDLSFVHRFVDQTYAAAGRPCIDPVVFFKLQLVMFFEGIRSERQLMRHAADRLSVRWYLGYDLGELLPDHSSLTRIRARYGVEVFRRFFEAIVDQCQQAGLVWGKELYADATKVQANAALSSMKPRFAVEAHLTALFAQEADEHEEAKEEATQHGNGLEREVADGRLDSPAACLPSMTPEEVDERVGPSPPCQLPAVLDEALHDVDPNLWRPQRGDLAHQLFVHQGTHVLQGGVSPAPIIETLDVFKGAASGLRSCLKGLTINAFAFETMEEAFHRRIIIAVGSAAHTYYHAFLL